jgi:ATP-dependent Clp protease ATP-binding subunit ClpX
MLEIGLNLLLMVVAMVVFVTFPALVALAIPFGMRCYKLRIKDGIKPIAYVGKRQKPPHPLRELFINFPTRLATDYCLSDPNDFPERSIHIIEGEQGKGKTITAVYLALKYKREYPRMKLYTNMNMAFEDGRVEKVEDIIGSENGKAGEVIVVDEVQNLFSSLKSKEFPETMLWDITQCRKQTKLIIGTSQVFTRVAKPIREQTYRLYTPLTLCGCLTIVRVSKPVLDENANALKSEPLGFFWFVHTDEIRGAYDTYHKIEGLKK